MSAGISFETVSSVFIQFWIDAPDGAVDARVQLVEEQVAHVDDLRPLEVDDGVAAGVARAVVPGGHVSSPNGSDQVLSNVASATTGVARSGGSAAACAATCFCSSGTL